MKPEALKICVISGSRADYGLLVLLLQSLKMDPYFKLQFLVSGTHLSDNFGNTVSDINTDGLRIDQHINILVAGSDAHSVCCSIAKAVEGFSRAYVSLKPDLIVVLGDRYEIFAAVQAALIHTIPVAHIAGGDITEGAYDDSLRHSISKMSHLHFTTNPQSAARIRQLGENPQHVYSVGSPGIDLIKSLKLLTIGELQEQLQISFHNPLFLVCFHPATLDSHDVKQQCTVLFTALKEFPDACIVFTGANADTEGRQMNHIIRDYVANTDNTYFFQSLGQLKYLSLLQCADVLIGNSSSGLYEAPSFGTPTVNIGIRQQGRLKANSVLDCALEPHDIVKCIHTALSANPMDVENPYGDGKSVTRILEVLRTYDRASLNNLIIKKFYGVDHA